MVQSLKNKTNSIKIQACQSEAAPNHKKNHAFDANIMFIYLYRSSMNQRINEPVETLKSELIDLKKQISSYTAEKLVKKQKQLTKQLMKIQRFLTHLDSKQDFDCDEPTQNPTISKPTTKIPSQSPDHGKEDSKILYRANNENPVQMKWNAIQHKNQIMREVRHMWNLVLKQIKLKVLASFIPEYYFTFFAYLLNKQIDNQSDQVFFVSDSQTNLDKLIKLQIYQSHLAKNYEENSFVSKIMENSIQLFKNYSKKIHGIFGSINETLAHFRSIECQFQVPSPIFNPKRCWSCVTHFYRNSQLLEQESPHRQKNYCIGENPSSMIFTEKSRNLIESVLCRVLNQEGGFIYLGLEEVKQNFVDSNKVRFGTNNLQKNFILSQTQQKACFKRKNFVVQGVKIDCQTNKHREKLTIMLNNYIKNYICPKGNQLIELFIDYLPVLPSYTDFKQKKITENGRYVIRIQVKHQKTLRLKYVETNKLDNRDAKTYSFYGEEEDLGQYSKKCGEQDQQGSWKVSRVYGSDIYELMLRKYYRLRQKKQQKQNQLGVFNSLQMREQYKKYGQNCNQYRYPIRCNLPLHLPDHEYNKQLADSEVMEQNNQQQSFLYLKTQAQYMKQAQIYNKAHSNWDSLKNNQLPNKLMKNLIPTAEAKFDSDPTCFGNVPDTQTFHYTSIVIVSPKGCELKLFDKFIKMLQESKIYFKLSPFPYHKIPKSSVREVSVINHAVKYEVLNEIAKKIDHQKRNLVVLDTRKQMMLQSSDNYTKALIKLTQRFKFVFQANFRAGFKDIVSTKGKGKLETQYYFSFQTEKQAIFAFILLEYNIIKCDFVNEIKLQGLELNQF